MSDPINNGESIPLTLSGNLILNIVGGISGRRVASSILGISELCTENLPVRIIGNVLDDDSLLVVGDLVDDELGLAAAHTEVVEFGDAFIIDGDTG